MGITKYAKALELACELDDFYYGFDYYGYMDSLETPTEAGREANRYSLCERILAKDTGGIIDELKSIAQMDHDLAKESQQLCEKLYMFGNK